LQRSAAQQDSVVNESAKSCSRADAYLRQEPLAGPLSRSVPLLRPSDPELEAATPFAPSWHQPEPPLVYRPHAFQAVSDEPADRVSARRLRRIDRDARRELSDEVRTIRQASARVDRGSKRDGHANGRPETGNEPRRSA
jgi:hypothetical protein